MKRWVGQENMNLQFAKLIWLTMCFQNAVSLKHVYWNFWHIEKNKMRRDMTS